MKVIILHGWAGRPFEGWSGWLGSQLRTLGFEVDNPYLPDAEYPRQDRWVAEINESIGTQNSNIILVGHSLGAVAILRALENFKENQKIKAAILVCCFTNDIGLEATKDFFRKPFDWTRIRTGAEKFIIINSDDDPYMALSEGKKLRENLGGELIIEHRAGHINEAAGFKTYPRLLEIIKNCSRSTANQSK